MTAFHCHGHIWRQKHVLISASCNLRQQADETSRNVPARSISSRTGGSFGTSQGRSARVAHPGTPTASRQARAKAFATPPALRSLHTCWVPRPRLLSTRSLIAMPPE
jgi:hypothetical protein